MVVVVEIDTTNKAGEVGRDREASMQGCRRCGGGLPRLGKGWAEILCRHV